MSTDFIFFLRCKILNTSFLSESLMMTFLDLAFDFKQWQASVCRIHKGVTLIEDF